MLKQEECQWLGSARWYVNSVNCFIVKRPVFMTSKGETIWRTKVIALFWSCPFSPGIFFDGNKVAKLVVDNAVPEYDFQKQSVGGVP